MTIPRAPRLTRRTLVAAGAALAVTPRSVLRAAPTRQSDAPLPVKAIYLNPTITTDPAEVRSLIDLINATELNALVVDVKEEGVYVETDLPFYAKADAVRPYFDADALLADLERNDIRAIARLVVFKDNLVATARPDLAVIDTATGAPWVDDGGNMWLNPLKQEVWEATVSLAEQLAKQGFDEIQFDYVRFPSDGDLSRLDFGQPVDDTVRIQTITDFLGFARPRLAALGAATAADVFGYTLLLDDIGIGQNVKELRHVVDVLCPMVYPSHFPYGSIDVPGHPNDFPAETIAISMADGAQRIEPSRIRPWLQDFTLPGMSAYGAPQVRAQIDAAEAGGAGGWMIWNAASVYNVDAFLPAEPGT